MSPRTLIPLLACILLALPACSGKTKTSKPKLASTVSGGGAEVATKVIPPPTLQAPTANETLYVAHVVDSATGRPIGGAFCYLVRNIPEPLYLRSPKRADVVYSNRTPLHGQNSVKLNDATADKNGVKIMDGKMKWWLVSGKGFTPKLVEAGPAIAGSKQEVTIRTSISPVATFRVFGPNGDLADNAICTMAPDLNQPEITGKMGARGSSSGNVGMTERADDSGDVWFNRPAGRYRLSFSASNGKYRHYQIFQWDGVRSPKPTRVDLPAKSMAKPW
ncbi:MAG: hypothetical protein GY747_06310 [Planctomycetes bacterium]|nr:hypothetical protein [Planctomycetota bacterium]MCP4771385.1 hypothetical protein [Planctomycetota bacterium]